MPVDSPLLPEFPELQSLTLEQQQRVLEACLGSPEYQSGAGISRMLSWVFLFLTFGAMVTFLMHRYLAARVFLFTSFAFAFLRILKKKQQIRILRNLVARQIAKENA